MPWRNTRDPYAIWISEIMLQQTQVRTVIPYWERWMREMPDAATLANAPIDRVLKLWEGLGYYTRARNLQKAAREIVEKHGGQFPTDTEAILALPGIGRYTVGAIASIAFNRPQPLLDGNVLRVLTRVYGIGGNPKDKAVNERLWTLSGELVQAASRQADPDNTNCSHLNQSLMELGATVCLPRQPKCGECPLEQICVARKQNRQEAFPELEKRAATTRRRFFAYLVRSGDRVLVRQRPDGVVNAGLWEFPNVEVTDNPKSAAEIASGSFGWSGVEWQPVTTLQHSITRYRITVEAYESARPHPGLKGGDWFSSDQLESLAFTSAHKKILHHWRKLIKNGGSENR